MPTAKKKTPVTKSKQTKDVLSDVALAENPQEHKIHGAEVFVVKRDTMIGEAADKVPDAAEIMFSYGLHCFGCGMTAYETIEQGCGGHGMSDEEIDNLVDELNESLKRHDKP